MEVEIINNEHISQKFVCIQSYHSSKNISFIAPSTDSEICLCLSFLGVNVQTGKKSTSGAHWSMSQLNALGICSLPTDPDFDSVPKTNQ